MKYYVKHAKCLSLVVGTVMLFAFGAAHAAVSEQQASRLGKDLTPLGGETAGNADGSIPAWTGGLSKPPAVTCQASITLIRTRTTNRCSPSPRKMSSSTKAN